MTGPLLVVEDDEGARRLLVRYLEQHRPVRVASTAEEAVTQLCAHDDWSGFLIDVALGMHPRAGLDVLATARRVFPSIPASLVTGSNERDIINRAASLSASFICKPFGATELTAFIERVIAADTGLDESLEGRLHSAARRWNLAPRESEILAWLVAGKTRESYMTRTGMTSRSWAFHVGRLLAKTGAKRTGELVTAVLRDHTRSLTRRERTSTTP